MGETKRFKSKTDIEYEKMSSFMYLNKLLTFFLVLIFFFFF